MSNSIIIDKSALKISGKRISLQIIKPEMVTECYVKWLNDPSVNRFLETRFSTQSLDTCRGFVSAAFSNPTEFLMGIFINSENRHIGNIKLGAVNQNHLTGQISLFIGDTAYWGKGYAREAIQLIAGWGFANLSLKKIEAGCYDQNLASLRTFLSVGFQVEGFFRSHVDDQGLRCGSFWMGILPGELK